MRISFQIIAILVFLLLGTQSANSELFDNLVGYYPFSGSANDESGNGNDGVVFGATLTEGFNGSPSCAYNFDGVDDYIDFGNVFNSVSVPFTVCTWVLLDSGSDTEEPVFYSDDGSGYSGIRFMCTTDGVSIHYGDGGPAWSSSRRSGWGSTDLLQSGEWVHIAGVVRGPTDMSIYINGEAVAVGYGGSGGSMVHSSAPARVGRRSEVSHYFPGLIDELYVFDRDLSSSEISELIGGFVATEKLTVGSIKALFR